MSHDNPTGARWPTIQEQIFQQVLHWPERVAVVTDSGTLTYRELWSRAEGWRDAFAPHIVAGEQAVIPILRPRDADLPAIQLGAWLAGAAYLPLDPTTPAGRVRTIVADAGCRVMVSAPGMSAVPAGLPQITAPVAVADREPQAPPADPRSLAYLIFTSGSSGRPKGVAIEHLSVSHLVDWYAPMCGIGAGTRTAIFTGLGFDATVVDTWASLARGARLYIPDETVIRSPEAVLDTINRAGIEHCVLATPMAEYVLSAETAPSGLRTLVAGGDRLRIWPAESFPAAVHNVYGPTETCVLSTTTADLRTHPGRAAGGPPPIGRPPGHTTVLLVDDDGEAITEPGRQGELLIGGPGLARGYHGAPELTDAAFVVFPDGTRWYRSGDLCTWTADGELDFAGRRDGQVKIRGYRIELGEVEHALMRHPQVRMATAAVVDDTAGDRSLVAWIMAEPGSAVGREFLGESLPEHMIPAEVIQVDRLPLNANGKPDRAELVKGYRPGQEGATDVVHATETERAVALLWQELLGRLPAADSNFFELGGHSLKAQQLVSRVRSALRVRMSVIDVFDHPDLRSFAGVIDDRRAGTGR